MDGTIKHGCGSEFRPNRNNFGEQWAQFQQAPRFFSDPGPGRYK
jgi:hypothetical protein